MTPRDALRAALWTALFAFLGLFGLGLVGWLTDLLAWASSEGQSAFPPLSTLGYLLVAAVVSAAIGLVNGIVRWAQAQGVIPGSGPSYGDYLPAERGQAGQATVWTIVGILAAVALLIVVVRALAGA